MLTRLLHHAVHAFQTLRRGLWFVTRPQTSGVHGIPLTPDGKLVLVTLSYAKGWRVPGGGRKQSESSYDGLLRELREEIGLIAHDRIVPVCDFTHRPDFRRGEASLFVVHGVHYRPRWSLEVKEVAEFALDQLPPDLPPITRRLLDLAELGSAAPPLPKPRARR